MSDPFARQLDIKGLSVFIGMPSHRPMEPETVVSLLSTQSELNARGIPSTIELKHRNSLVHHARTGVAWDFLQSKCNRLFWIDSDMVWEAKDFLRVLALSTVMDMVAVAYLAKQDPPLFMIGNGLDDIEMNEWGCFKRDGLGIGFCCMTREVVEAVAKASPKLVYNTYDEPVPRMFRLDGITKDLHSQGEDMAFFEDAKAAGYDLWIDPSISLGHVGTKVYRARLADYMSAASNSPTVKEA